jgi:hypothetical protein
MQEEADAAGRPAQTTQAQDTAGADSPRDAHANATSPQGEDPKAPPAADEDDAEDDTDTEDDAETDQDDPDEIEAESDEETDEQERPKSRLERRIPKLVAERNQLRKELAELKRSGANQGGIPQDFLLNDPEYKRLHDAETAIQTVLAGTRKLRLQLDNDPDEGLKEFGRILKITNPDLDEAKAWVDEFYEEQRGRMGVAIAERVARRSELQRERVAQRVAWMKEVDLDMPWVGNRKDPRQRYRAAILKEYPFLEHIPGGPWIAAVAAHKMAKMENRGKSTGTQAPAGTQQKERRVLPSGNVGTSQAIRQPIGDRNRRLSDAMKRHTENPDDAALSEFLDVVSIV